MKETFEEFSARIKRVHDSRKHKITNSLGVYDAYKYIRKNKWFNIQKILTEKEFYSIIREVNTYLALELSNGKEIKLPHKLGTLEVRKRYSRLSIINGKLVTNLPIDWDATLRLWNEDLESFDNKTLVRVENNELFNIIYNKHNALYNNKGFYDFRPNREIKKNLNKLAKEGNLEAFLWYKKYD